jgi:hypothetical protein
VRATPLPPAEHGDATAVIIEAREVSFALAVAIFMDANFALVRVGKRRVLVFLATIQARDLLWIVGGNYLFIQMSLACQASYATSSARFLRPDSIAGADPAQWSTRVIRKRNFVSSSFLLVWFSHVQPCPSTTR